MPAMLLKASRKATVDAATSASMRSLVPASASDHAVNQASTAAGGA